VLVLAQEEARLLNHSFIGTEHLLLGLIRDEDGLAARALAAMKISPASVRDEIAKIVGQSPTVQHGSPPFTPRAKKVLELSLREALELGHNYIGSEHMLLGLVREGEGVAAHVLIALGADLASVRQQVIHLVGAEARPTNMPGRRTAESDDLADLTLDEGSFAPIPTGDHWTARVVRAGRDPEVFAEAYQALRDLVAPFGVDLDETDPSLVMVVSVLTSGGPGLLLSLRHQTDN
jgi:ATP-dependent Clp protease ATP-binding subunit ClpA